ncbi:MAG: YggS family pyridoxal phosphate-dependent enzyme [Desulfobacterales bacterium]|nr:MAG: YggS family pyridoxal phosphate-dependent enzyme [Desulfobacterales bacterium]
MKERLATIKERIQTIAEACHRKAETVRLVAVSKTVPVEIVKEAIDAGVTILGENYIQEAREKCNALISYPVSWHFIGHLQSNKAKYAVRLFDLIHSVDSLKLALEINKQAKKINRIQSILVQVNIAREASKSGVYVEEATRLIEALSPLENLAVRGLMTIPPYFDAPEKARPFFAALRELRDQIERSAIPNIAMDELSMGMTGDFEAAIEEGATLVRIGTAIFGARK